MVKKTTISMLALLSALHAADQTPIMEDKATQTVCEVGVQTEDLTGQCEGQQGVLVAPEEREASLVTLPSELLAKIFSHLEDPKDWVAVQGTCRRFYSFYQPGSTLSGSLSLCVKDDRTAKALLVRPILSLVGDLSVSGDVAQNTLLGLITRCGPLRGFFSYTEHDNMVTMFRGGINNTGFMALAIRQGNALESLQLSAVGDMHMPGGVVRPSVNALDKHLVKERFPRVRHLKLDRQNLSDAKIAELATEFPNLESLSLQQRLNGGMPPVPTPIDCSAFTGMEHLQGLNLEGTQAHTLEALPRKIRSLTFSMEEIHQAHATVGRNAFSFADISHLEDLENLQLTMNNMGLLANGQHLQAYFPNFNFLENHRSLRSLDIVDSSWMVTTLQGLSRAKDSLTKLVMTNTRVQDFSEVGECYKLQELDLRENTQMLSTAFLRNLRELRSLNLDELAPRDAFIDDIMELPYLEDLTFSTQQISQDKMDEFLAINGKKLKKLHVQSMGTMLPMLHNAPAQAPINVINDADFIEKIAAFCENLEELTFEASAFLGGLADKDRFVELLQMMPNLKKITMRGTSGGDLAQGQNITVIVGNHDAPMPETKRMSIQEYIKYRTGRDIEVHVE